MWPRRPQEKRQSKRRRAGACFRGEAEAPGSLVASGGREDLVKVADCDRLAAAALGQCLHALALSAHVGKLQVHLARQGGEGRKRWVSSARVHASMCTHLSTLGFPTGGGGTETAAAAAVAAALLTTASCPTDAFLHQEKTPLPRERLPWRAPRKKSGCRGTPMPEGMTYDLGSVCVARVSTR